MDPSCQMHWVSVPCSSWCRSLALPRETALSLSPQLYRWNLFCRKQQWWYPGQQQRFQRYDINYSSWHVQTAMEKRASLGVHILWYEYILQCTNISHLQRRKIIVKSLLGKDMLVPRRVCRNMILNLDQNKSTSILAEDQTQPRNSSLRYPAQSLSQKIHAKWTTRRLESIKRAQMFI